MKKFFILAALVASMASHAGMERKDQKVAELKALTELPATCPSIKMPKMVADYRDSVNRAKGTVVQPSPEEQKAVDAFIKECWWQAVIDKQDKK